MNLLRILQEVDRRVLYALLLLSVTVPFFLNIRVPVTIQKDSPSRMLYDVIEGLPQGSFVLLGPDYSAGSRGENGPQTEVLIRHLMQRKLRFAILSFDPQGPTLAQRTAERLESSYNVKEGVDWINWGYRPPGAMVLFLKSMAQDIKGAVKTDIHGKPVADQPVMQGVDAAKDIKLILNVNPTNGYSAYIQFLQGPYHIPMGLAPTSVMAPEAFTYLSSGQLCGMINGLNGAIEYEQLLGVVGAATRDSNCLSISHFLIIVLIIMGNVAMVLEKRSRKSAGPGGAP